MIREHTGMNGIAVYVLIRYLSHSRARADLKCKSLWWLTVDQLNITNQLTDKFQQRSPDPGNVYKRMPIIECR